MDAQGRGQAGDIDPADQWVFDPNTGSYQLRLNPGTHNSPQSYGNSSSAAPPHGESGRTAPSSARPHAESSDAARSESGRSGPKVPAQRSGSASEGGHRAGGHSRRRRKTARSGRRKVLRWTAGTLGVLLVAGCAGGYYLYEQFNGNINKVDVGMDNEAVTDGPVNILVLGTDARDGKGNSGYGDKGSVGHADTTFLFHVSSDRSNATALSIPRDIITDIPACPTKQDDGSTKTVPGQQNVRFNTSLGQNDRDPGCTWRTVEKMTGVKINHFMMADFNAVKELSSAVGGVEVCAAKDINDPKSHLRLKAGKHTVQGEQALAFVRTRHSVGFGSDLSRIELQQQFLSSMIRKMKSGDTLTNPKKLYKLGNAATKALTVDTGIGSVKKLTDLAQDLRRVNIKNITFATVPVLDNPEDPATVILDEEKAKPLFQMVREDKSLTKVKKKQHKEDKGGGKAVEAAPAAEVQVNVTNGGGPAGSAQNTAVWLLNEQGVARAENGGNAPKQVAKTRVEYTAEQAGQATALVKMLKLPKSSMKKVADGGSEDVHLTLGRDFTAPGEPVSAPDKAPDGVQRVNADDKNICAK